MPTDVNAGDFVSNLPLQSTAGYLLVVAADVTPTSGYTQTIPQSSMGPNGFFTYDAWFLISNTGATAVQCTFDTSFGGTALQSRTCTSTSSTTPRYTIVRMSGVIANTADEALQRNMVFYGDQQGQDTTGVGTVTNLGNIKTSSVDTGTADRDFDITLTLSTATNSKAERLAVIVNGPFYS